MGCGSCLFRVHFRENPVTTVRKQAYARRQRRTRVTGEERDGTRRVEHQVADIIYRQWRQARVRRATTGKKKTNPQPLPLAEPMVPGLSGVQQGGAPGTATPLRVIPPELLDGVPNHAVTISQRLGLPNQVARRPWHPKVPEK